MDAGQAALQSLTTIERLICGRLIAATGRVLIFVLSAVVIGRVVSGVGSGRR